MRRRLFLTLGALLTLCGIAFGDGAYQRTRDGKTLVWNNDPKPGDEATWSGDRDTDGYAHGFGTLTWYTKENDAAKTELYARYWGNMVKGKFDGPVNVHTRRRTGHAMFAEGTRMTRWMEGPSSLREASRWRALAEKRKNMREPEAPAEGLATVEAPAEGPDSVEARPTPIPSIEPVPTESSQDLALNSAPPQALTLATPAPAEIERDEALMLLVWPPPVLNLRSISRAARADVVARLTKQEVVDLADTTARSGGYNPTDYQVPDPQYDPSDQAWSLLYEQKPTHRTGDASKHFSVAVADKTKRTALAPRR